MNTTTTRPMGAPGTSMAGWPRIASAILGAWLFISAFIWPHTTAQMTNTWICGLLAVFFAWVGAFAPQARFFNTVLAIWLFISAFALSSAHHGGTIWNNAVVAILLFVTSLLPGTGARRTLAT